MNNIHTATMRYVCEVAKHGHFGKAALHCNTSQPNISAQIKALETQLGILIFNRKKTPITLTAKGKEVYGIFKDTLHQLDALTRLKNKNTPTHLKLGIFPSLAPYYLPAVLKQWQSDFPTIPLHIHEDKTAAIVQALTQGHLDCIIASPPLNDPSLLSQELFKDLFYCAVHPSHPFAQQTHVSLSSLSNEPVLLLQDGHCLRDQTLAICPSHAPTNTPAVTSIETLLTLIAANYGIGIIPAICKQPTSRLCYIPFKDPIPFRRVCLFWNPTHQYLHFFKHMLCTLGKIKTIPYHA